MKTDMQIIDDAPSEPIEIIDSDNESLEVTHYSANLNCYMVRGECGEWYSYDEEADLLMDEYAQHDIRLLADIDIINSLNTITKDK